MSETEYPAEFVRRSFQPNFIYRLPSDVNKCYAFRLVGVTEVKPFLVCVVCERMYAKSRREAVKGKHPVKRCFEGTQMRDDPTLRHTTGCEPVLYSAAISKLVKADNDYNTTKNKKWFQLEKYQKYAYNIVYRLPDNPTLCYRFSILHRAVKHLRLQCDQWSSRRAGRKSCPARLCTPNGFIADPTENHNGCELTSYQEFIEKNEIIGKDEAEKLMFERTIDGELIKNNDAAEDRAVVDTSSNLSRIQVIEIRQRVTYIYRIPGNVTQCYRFIVRLARTSHIDLLCSTCHGINMQRNANGLKILPGRSYKTDGFRMLEDPMVGHNSDCKLFEYSGAIKGFRILDDDNVGPPSGDFPLVRTMKCGQRNLMYTLESDPTKCYHFQFQAAKSIYCASCYSIARKNMVHHRTMYGFTGYEFLDDPLANHNPECMPLTKNALLNKYQLVDAKSAQNFLEFLKAPTERIISHTPSADSLTLSSSSAYPVHVVEKRRKPMSFMYRLKDNSDKCYRFNVHVGSSNYNMQCAVCAKHSFIANRETDGFSMKSDPSVGHCKECQPLNCSKVFKNYRQTKPETDFKPKYGYSLEPIELRKQFNAIYILSNDSTKCHRFFFAYYYNTKSMVSWGCSACFKISHTNWINSKQEVDKDAVREHFAKYRCSIDGFIDDPRLNHFPGCEPLLYSDVMKELEVVDETRTTKLFKDGDYGYKDVESDNSIEEPSPTAKRRNTPIKENAKDESNGFSMEAVITTQPPEVLRASKSMQVLKPSKKCKPAPETVDKNRNASNAHDAAIGIRKFLRSAKNRNINDEPTISVSPLNVSMSEVVEMSPVIDNSSAEDTKPTNINHISDIPDMKPNISKPKIKSDQEEIMETKPTRDVKVTRSKTFSHTFDIPMFSEDEVELTIRGRTVYVECKRESKWFGGELQITAQMVPEA